MIINWLDRTITFVRNLLIGLSALAAAIMMLHVTASVLSRYLFNAPFASTIQIVSAYYMVLISLGGLAYAAYNGGHIIVELFTMRLSERTRNWIDGIAGLIMATYLALLTWYNAIEAWRRSIEGEVWEISAGYLEVWPARWLVPIGCGVTCAYILLRSIRLISRLIHGR